MCSVFGCYSWRRRYAQRFKLPEDPERRLEWVQFLAAVNKQRFKESSWTDISICSQHFKDDCFELTPSHSGETSEVRLTLKSSAVPTVCLYLEADRPETHLEKAKCDPVEIICDGPTSCSEESRQTSRDAQESPVLRGPLGPTDTSDFFISVHGQKHPKNVNSDLMKKKAALLQKTGKYVVNEKRLLQLFSHKCPSCGSKLQMEKVTYGVVVMLNQKCLQCEYRNQWKSQVNASVPTADDQQWTGGREGTAEPQEAAPTDGTHGTVTEVPEVIAIVDEESEPTEGTEKSSEEDEDWKPVNDFLKARELQKETGDKIKDEDEEEEEEEEEEDDDEDEDEDDDEDGDEGCGYYILPVPRFSELCPECGKFFSKARPHTCEHKLKPYSCNICGKRCVSEVALNCHSRVHDETYEHRCKYCYSTFRTKVDKQTHEHTHVIEGKPYKCPDCSETFATNKQRRIHLEDHRGPPQLKCHICGIEFRSPPYLQRHLAVHTGEKPFKCSVCQRGFNQAGHLKSHMRLHTGERPYKCQHCDKCFNHNVSLKSHVQRYHSSNSGCEKKKQKRNEREGNADEAAGNGNTAGADDAEEEQDSEEKEQEEIQHSTKTHRRSTGRPIGRPKSSESGSVVLAVQVEGQCSNSKTKKQRAQKTKRTRCSNDESEDEPSGNDTSSDLAKEKEEKSKKAIRNTARLRGRPKKCGSDSDFDPEERKKKRYSSQNSGKSSGKRRGRPRKKLVV